MKQAALETVELGRFRLLTCCILLAASGAAQAVLVFLVDPWWRGQVVLHVAYIVVTGAAILVAARPGPGLAAPRWTPWIVLGGSFLVTLALAQFALQAFPNSADEYGYNYVADTLLHGRLWNPTRPEALRDVFETFYIAERDGKRASQYPPGWPAVLAAFKLADIPQFANAIVGLAAALFLWLGLRRLQVPQSIRLAALILGVAAPFTLLNNASFFNHPLTAAALLGIVWLDLRDAARPSPWNRAGIGFGFSVLLATRYETFLIAAVLFVAGGFLRRGARFVGWALPAVAGGSPVTALLLVYNWQITDSPFETTLAWASPGISYGLHATGIDGQHSALRGFENTGLWLESWQDFAGVLLLPLYGLALWRRVASRTVRWFDLILPAVVVFFFFYPDNGGFQYGPRYWFLGYVPLPLTVAAGLPHSGDLWRLGRRWLDPLRLALAQLAAFAGFTAGFAVYLHILTDVRTLPLRAAAQALAPAVVLVRDEALRYVPWQKATVWLLSLDYTRNGVGDLGPVAIGRDLGEARTALLCEQMPDRRLYRLQLMTAPPRARLLPACNGAR